MPVEGAVCCWLFYASGHDGWWDKPVTRGYIESVKTIKWQRFLVHQVAGIVSATGL